MRRYRSLVILGIVAAVALGGAPAHAAPTGASSLAELEASPLPMTEADLAAFVRGIGDSGAVVEVEESNATRSTTYDLAGITVKVVEEAVSVPGDDVSVQFDIDTRFLPRFVFVYLSRADQQALASGGTSALNVALCAIPAVGWVSCGAITAAVQGAAEYLKAHGLCQKNFLMKLDFNSVPNNWITFDCV